MTRSENMCSQTCRTSLCSGFSPKSGRPTGAAPGTDFGTKLMGMLDTFPKAFETYWPGLGGIDLLVGLAGAAGMYLLIQSKIRQAKKFRRDAEYGTARFGTKEDIKPFVDPKFQNNVILTGTQFLTMNTRPKVPANARNLNACVIGSSGSGKTRFWLTPQLLSSPFLVCAAVDPKGGTLDQCGRFLQREKYRVRVFNSIVLLQIHALQSAGLYQDGKRCFEIRYRPDCQYQRRWQGGRRSSGQKPKPFCTAPLWPISSLRGRRKNAT